MRLKKFLHFADQKSVPAILLCFFVYPVIFPFAIPWKRAMFFVAKRRGKCFFLSSFFTKYESILVFWWNLLIPQYTRYGSRHRTTIFHFLMVHAAIVDFFQWFRQNLSAAAKYIRRPAKRRRWPLHPPGKAIVESYSWDPLPCGKRVSGLGPSSSVWYHPDPWEKKYVQVFFRDFGLLGRRVKTCSHKMMSWFLNP